MENKNAAKSLPAVISAVIILIIAVVSITNGSLWGDEICRVVDPISGDLSATLKTALGFAQPGYMLFMLVWTKLVGTTEYLLRCSNLLFAVLAMVYVFKIVRSRGWSIWWSILFFAHPMFVYYMNEATPYIMVYSLALAFVYHVFCVGEFHALSNIIWINGIFLLGVYIHFMFGFIIILYFVKCIMEMIRSRQTIFRHIKVMVCFSPFYLFLLWLYIRNLNGTHTGFGIKSVFYIIYSFLGMQGAGLSRNELRAGNFNHIQTGQIILLIAFAVALLLLFFTGIKEITAAIKKNKDMAVAFIAYFIVIIVVSVPIGFGLWERHCMTVFPVFMIFACDIFNAYVKKKEFHKGILIVYFVLLCFSSYNIIFNYYYSCDDVKGVAGEIRERLARDDNLIVIDTARESRYYPYKDAASDPDKQYIGMADEDEEKILEYMETLKGQDVLLVLFEKNCSKNLYRYFDDAEGYNVNSQYNSYKLITEIR